MSDLDFWSIINLLDWQAEEDADVIAPAVRYLSGKSEEVIYAFQDQLSQKLYELDQRVFAEQIGTNAYGEDNYFSVDEFLYARACVVANGQKAYEHIKAHPEDMPKDLTFEPILEIASTAFRIKTGKEWDYIPSLNYETFSNEEGWQQKAS